MKEFSKLQFEKRKTHLIFYDNSADDDFGKVLKQYMDRNKSRFSSVKYVKDDTVPVAGKGLYKTEMVSRVMNNIKKYIKTEFWFNLEDDTTCDPDAILKLMKLMIDRNVAACQGVELSRWDKITAGVGRLVETVHYPPISHEKLGTISKEVRFGDYIPVRDSGIERIGSGGLYCNLFRMSVMKGLDFVAQISGIGGTDICMGYSINSSGYLYMIDWSVRCSHWAVDPDDSRNVEIRC